MDSADSDDITAKMLSALTDNSAPAQESETPPLIEQKIYIRDNVNYLTNEDKCEVANIIVKHELGNRLNWCSDGTAVDLDAIPPEVLVKLYHSIKYKIDRYTL